MNDCVTEKEIPVVVVTSPEPDRFEVFHDKKPTGTRGKTLKGTLEWAVSLMQSHPKWTHVEVLDVKGANCGGVWRNPLEGRLIKGEK